MKKTHKPYNKFKIWLKDNTVTYADIANLIGRSETSVAQKINGYSDFLLSEIQLIIDFYKLKSDIFFADDVA